MTFSLITTRIIATPTNHLPFHILRYAVSTKWERDVAQGNAPSDIHTYFCCCARRIGHMFALLSYPDGSPIMIAGPCWPFCMFVTRTLFVLSSMVVFVGSVFIVCRRVLGEAVARGLILTHVCIPSSSVPLILGIAFLVSWFLVVDSQRFNLVCLIACLCSDDGAFGQSYVLTFFV